MCRFFEVNKNVFYKLFIFMLYIQKVTSGCGGDVTAADCGSYCSTSSSCTLDSTDCGCKTFSDSFCSSCSTYAYNIQDGGKCTGILGTDGDMRCSSDKCKGGFCCSSNGKADIALGRCVSCRDLGFNSINIKAGDCNCKQNYYSQISDGRCGACPAGSTTSTSGKLGLWSCLFGDEGTTCNTNSNCNSGSCKTRCCGTLGQFSGTVACDQYGEAASCVANYYRHQEDVTATFYIRQCKPCPSGTISDAGSTSLIDCKAYELISSSTDSCERIKTKNECENAASFLQLSDTYASLDEQGGVSYDPPYCYFESSELKFNADGSNTGDCTSSDKCLCKKILVGNTCTLPSDCTSGICATRCCAANINNCAQCNSNGECSTCNSGYYKASSTCLTKKSDGVQCTGSNQCSSGTCATRCCAANINNCAQCNSNGECSTCNSGYYKASSTCLTKKSDGVQCTGSNQCSSGTCATRCCAANINNCAQCNSNGECSTCNSGYYKASSTCLTKKSDGVQCTGSNQCSSGTCATRCCAANINNCAQCNSNGECSTCNSGYYKASSTCLTKKSDGVQCTGSNQCSSGTCATRCCAANINNCAQCNSNGECSTCNSGYYESSGVCLTQQSDGVQCTGSNQCSSGTCATRCCAANINNCAQCNSNGECSTCNSGYYESSGSCFADKSDKSYELISSSTDSCERIKTKNECENAASFLQLSDTYASLDEQGGVSYDPPYCYFESSELKFNADGSNTGDCDNSDVCLCSKTANNANNANNDGGKTTNNDEDNLGNNDHADHDADSNNTQDKGNTGGSFLLVIVFIVLIICFIGCCCYCCCQGGGDKDQEIPQQQIHNNNGLEMQQISNPMSSHSGYSYRQANITVRAQPIVNAQPIAWAQIIPKQRRETLNPLNAVDPDIIEKHEKKFESMLKELHRDKNAYMIDVRNTYRRKSMGMLKYEEMIHSKTSINKNQKANVHKKKKRNSLFVGKEEINVEDLYNKTTNIIKKQRRISWMPFPTHIKSKEKEDDLKGAIEKTNPAFSMPPPPPPPQFSSLPPPPHPFQQLKIQTKRSEGIKIVNYGDKITMKLNAAKQFGIWIANAMINGERKVIIADILPDSVAGVLNNNGESIEMATITKVGSLSTKNVIEAETIKSMIKEQKRQPGFAIVVQSQVDKTKLAIVETDENRGKVNLSNTYLLKEEMEKYIGFVFLTHIEEEKIKECVAARLEIATALETLTAQEAMNVGAARVAAVRSVLFGIGNLILTVILFAGLGVVVGIIYLVVDIYGLYKAYQNCNIYFARKKYVAFVKDMRAKFDKLENATKDSTEKLTSLLDNGYS
eukprot:g7079.t1